MGGVVGRLMQEFALTLSAAVLVSIAMSLTLTPMLAGQFLRQPKPASTPVHPRRWSAASRGWRRSYARALDVVLRHTRLTLAVFLATMAFAVFLYIDRADRLLPAAGHRLHPGRRADLAGRLVRQDRRARSQQVAKSSRRTRTSTGSASSSAPAAPTRPISTSASSPRTPGASATPTQIINELRPKLARLVGVRALLQAAQDIRVGGRPGQAQYQYTLSDPDLRRAQHLGRRSWSAAMQAAAAAARRQLRPAVAGRGGQPDHRPGGGGQVRHRAGRHRRGDLRRRSASARWRSTSPR